MKAGKNPEPRKRLLKVNEVTLKVADSISLPTIDAEFSVPFFEVLKKRKSERRFKKLTLNQISNVLWHAAKARNISVLNKTQILFHTNSPSAGSIHPIDILVSLPATLTQRKLYFYDPFTHKLWHLKVNQRKLSYFFRSVDRAIEISNATILWFAADNWRTKEKYKNPESLVWRDAGALLMLVQLVATAFNIRSCAIGTLANPFFTKLFDNPKSYVSAGGILLG